MDYTIQMFVSLLMRLWRNLIEKFETVILLIQEDLIYNNIRLEDLLEMELNESILEKLN